MAKKNTESDGCLMLFGLWLALIMCGLFGFETDSPRLKLLFWCTLGIGVAIYLTVWISRLMSSYGSSASDRRVEADVEQRAIPHNVRQAVLDRDDYLCRYCGRRSQTMEIDHITPVSQGGESTLDNLVTACRRRNRKKAARTPEDAGMTVLPVRTEKRR
jgi:5-methylcytosine-specific restriction endonuclease McrA